MLAMSSFLSTWIMSWSDSIQKNDFIYSLHSSTRFLPWPSFWGQANLKLVLLACHMHSNLFIRPISHIRMQLTFIGWMLHWPGQPLWVLCRTLCNISDVLADSFPIWNLCSPSTFPRTDTNFFNQSWYPYPKFISHIHRLSWSSFLPLFARVRTCRANGRSF